MEDLEDLVRILEFVEKLDGLNPLKKKIFHQYPIILFSLHLQPVFKNLVHQEGDFPVSEKVANECLSLPMSLYLNESD